MTQQNQTQILTLSSHRKVDPYPESKMEKFTRPPKKTFVQKYRILAAKISLFCIFALVLVSHHHFSEAARVDLVFELVSLFFLGISAFGRTWSSAFIAGKKDLVLITSGPYSIIRNPLYFFNLLGFIGAGLAFESLIVATVFGLIFILTHWPTIMVEEKVLNRRFGQAFEDYKTRVPRLIPRSWRVTYPSEITLNPKRFSRALMESSLILLVFFVAHSIEWLHIHSILPVFFHII